MNLDSRARVSGGLLALLAILSGPAAADPDKLLDFCVAQPEHCAISVASVSEGWEAHLNPDRPQSLGSMYKILALLAYARAAARGAIDPEQEIDKEDWARYLAGGNSLATSWNYLGQPDRVPVDDLAWVMIRFSDNQVPDWLLANLKKQDFKKAARLFGWHDLPEAISAVFGLARGAYGEPGSGERIAADYGDFGVKAYVQELRKAFKSVQKSDRVVEALREARCTLPPWEAGPPPCKPPQPPTSVKTVRTLLLEHFIRSTSRSYLELMRGILDGSLLSPAEQQIVERNLEKPWFDSFPSLATAFTRYGSKGGSLAASAAGLDVMTTSWYLEASGQRYVVSVLLQDLTRSDDPPAEVDLAEFGQYFALAPAFRQRVRQLLAADDERPELIVEINQVKRKGGKLTVKVRIVNTSPNPSDPVDVDLVLSDGKNAANDVAVGTKELAQIRGHKAKRITFAVDVENAAGLLAVIHVDPDGALDEQEMANNVSWQRIN
jgi:Beta-lactamase enzyme family